MSDRATAFAIIANGFDAHDIAIFSIVFNDAAETITVSAPCAVWVCEIGSDDDAYVFTATTFGLADVTIAL